MLSTYVDQWSRSAIQMFYTSTVHKHFSDSFCFTDFVAALLAARTFWRVSIAKLTRVFFSNDGRYDMPHRELAAAGAYLSGLAAGPLWK